MVEVRGNDLMMKGVMFDPKEISPELVKDNFKRICSFEGKNEHPERGKVRTLLEKSKL